MKKDTAKLMEELKGFSDFKAFYDGNRTEIAEIPLSEYLQKIIDDKKLNKAEIIAHSELSEIYAYQIISGTRKAPTRNKLLCLAFGMGLTLDETQEMLKKTGYATLYARNPFDCVIIYGLFKGMSVVGVNELLYEYGQELLG